MIDTFLMCVSWLKICLCPSYSIMCIIVHMCACICMYLKHCQNTHSFKNAEPAYGYFYSITLFSQRNRMVVIYETDLHNRSGQCVNDCHHVTKAEKQLEVQSKQQDMCDIHLLLKAWRLSRNGCYLSPGVSTWCQQKMAVVTNTHRKGLEQSLLQNLSSPTRSVHQKVPSIFNVDTPSLSSSLKTAPQAHGFIVVLVGLVCFGFYQLQTSPHSVKYKSIPIW